MENNLMNYSIATLSDWVDKSDISSTQHIEQLFFEAKNLLIQTASEQDQSRKELKQDTLSGLLSSCLIRLGSSLSSQKALELLNT
jgi:hypothetical protein